MIWDEGYRNGDYRAHMYPEVPTQLQVWKSQGLDLYVYSSGSVAAQKLLFGYSDAGDLTPFFSGYFDTETGPKREAESYRRIAAAIGKPADEIMFLSDVVEELDAAQAAGMKTTLLTRAPARCPTTSAHVCVPDFNAVAPN